MDAQNLTPWFEFGFGLSYTTFGYSALVIAVSGMSQGYLTFLISLLFIVYFFGIPFTDCWS